MDQKAIVCIRRNVIAFNESRDLPVEDDDGDPRFYAPGIYVIDGAPEIVNNSIHANTGGNIEYGGGIDGERVGTFGPDWINNIVSANGGWGIFCRGRNTGARIDYNLGFDNQNGDFAPSIDVPGEAVFAHNSHGDPLYIDGTPGGLDLHLSSPASPAIDAGDCAPPPNPRTCSRLLNDPDGTCVDLGAFHFDQSIAIVPPPSSSLAILEFGPNPFTEAVTIKYSLPHALPAQMSVFNASGQLVHRQSVQSNGHIGSITWNPRALGERSVSAGTYFCRIDCGGCSDVIRLVALR